jgi:hypothetical protein
MPHTSTTVISADDAERENVKDYRHAEDVRRGGDLSRQLQVR